MLSGEWRLGVYSHWSVASSTVDEPFCTLHHLCECERIEVSAHVCAHLCPDSEQSALTLVFASAVLMGFSEIASDDRSIDSADYLTEADLIRRCRQHVASTDTALRSNQAGTLECQEDLFQIWLW